MASENTTQGIVLNNYSDDSKIKQYVANVLMPRVFHDIPLNTLNTGFFSIVNEYMSQAIENLAFTGSFYHNESFITKSVLADSIYSEAAIFNIGYSYATPSCCNFMLELKIEDLKKNSKPNASMKNVQEFILDKNTKINLSNGSVYSLDYDILIQYTKDENGNPSAWNIQYTNTNEQNSIAVNKKPYILYRTSEIWLHIFVKMSEFERQTHTIVNNMSSGIPNDDFVITCTNNIAGFDIKYIADGNESYLDSDHILPLHSDVKDQAPYVHYIMDNPQTIRFKFQMNGNRYFVPKQGSRFEITIYTCHGDAANFTSFKTNESVSVITATGRYTNNGNVQKTAFVMSGSLGGTNIGTIETTRRETIEAYNTANVISSDHDIYEWFKTFFFKNILYPFFFKRRDDPWGRIWSGFFALTDLNGDVFRTNTLHAKIPYRILYKNNDNIISNNEIIIPPGWSWIYENPNVNRNTVKPLVVSNDQVEPADTVAGTNSDFLFANPFGIRIQKSPFAIGYFNPWINETTTASYVQNVFTYQNTQIEDTDESIIYHATPSFIHVSRTYQNDFYKIETVVIPNQTPTGLGVSEFVGKLRSTVSEPALPEIMWNYFVKPADMFAPEIPILAQNASDQFIVFDPKNTYICAREKNRTPNGWILSDVFIEDKGNNKRYDINIKPDFDDIFGSDALWGDNGLWEAIKVTGDTSIDITPVIQEDESVTFNRVAAQNYYELHIAESVERGHIVRIVTTDPVFETSLTKYGETRLYRIGQAYTNTIYLTIYYDDGTTRECNIHNAANVYIPYTPHTISANLIEFRLSELTGGSIILYADMKPTQSEAAIAYYRIPFELVGKNIPMFHILSSTLSLNQNKLRVVMEAKVNGVVTGRVEMQPVSTENDGSIRFDTVMYPLNKMIDIDNRIRIASLNNGGGSWQAATENGVVSIDGTNPELTIYILFQSTDRNLPSPIDDDPDYTGYRLQDRWNIDPIPFVQELKEMRSVVHFGEYQETQQIQIDAYDAFVRLGQQDASFDNIYTIKQYAQNIITGIEPSREFSEIRVVASDMNSELDSVIIQYDGVYDDMPELRTEYMTTLLNELSTLSQTQYAGDVNWENIYHLTSDYLINVDEIFSSTSVNSAVEIQLVPFVQSSLMTSDMFESFVSSFTQVHKAIEPVIFRRLEGNNYLDCKLIATYGLPHSYVSDVDKDLNLNEFWPDLDIQIEFDIKLFNPALSTNTMQELKQMIRSYFNRITTVHTPIDMISMDNNIYISQLIQQMESHSNVAYLKFKGWYTNQKNVIDGHYMNADYQAIVQKWDNLEDMPSKELERYVPEMFVLSDSNIILNLI